VDEISATNGVGMESAAPASSQHDQGQSPNNSLATKGIDGSKTTNTQSKKKQRHEQGKAKEVEMDISEEVSGAEEGEASSSHNSDKEEPEAKGAEEKQPQQSAVAPPDGADAPHKKPRTKKTKHKKTTVNDVCMPMRQQAERESGQREHGDQTGEAAAVPPGNNTKAKGSRKKAKKLHKATEAGKAKEAVRDSSSLSAETVATVTMGGRQEEEESATIGLLDLPEEVLLGVLSFLAPPDLVLVSQACRLLQLLSREPTILRALREHHRIHVRARTRAV
jgi:hypothetical protein